MRHVNETRRITSVVEYFTQQILKYRENNSIHYCTDSNNVSSEYAVTVRNELFPAIKKCLALIL